MVLDFKSIIGLGECLFENWKRGFNLNDTQHLNESTQPLRSSSSRGNQG